MPSNIYRAKLVLVGEPTVGKTAISQMFISGGTEFPKLYNMSLGADVNSKMLTIPGTDDGVELLIYDSPGIDLYIDCLNKFWNRPDLLMVVFDVSNRKSLDFALNWTKIARSAEWSGEGPIAGVLFGNKTDLESRRICTDEDGLGTAENLNLKYYSGSAKDNQGLEDAFQYLAGEFYKYYIKKS